jgi:hypothetical protein
MDDWKVKEKELSAFIRVKIKRRIEKEGDYGEKQN